MRKHLLLIFICLLSYNTWSQNQATDYQTIIVKVNQESGLKSASSIQNLLYHDLKPFASSVQQLFPASSSLKTGNKPHAIHFLYRVKLDESEAYNSALHQLNELNYISYAEPLYIPHLLDTVNDPYLPEQYHIPLTEVIKAHELNQGDTNIVIGIVDTGIDMDHEDLVANIKYNYNDPINGIDDDHDGYVDNFQGWDIANNDPNPECTDSTDHGALVSGIAAATTNNILGIASPGYKCKFLPIKAANNYGSLIAPYEGIVYAADHGCHIINCSWGDTVKSLYAQDIIDYAVNYRGCVVVAAAGNAKNDTPYYPASLDGVISVGATSYGDVKWTGSTFGIELDLVAPGRNIYTTGYNNSYRFVYGGTSFAAPQVAGVAALLMANQPELSARQVAEKIRINSDVIDTIYENQYYYRLLGHGRLNAYKTLTDTILPGLRVKDHNFSSNNSPLIQHGDTALLQINVLNYLEKAGATSVLYSDNSNYTTIINDFHRLGDILTMDSANNYENPFSISINNDMPYDHEFVVSYDMAGTGFKDYQQFKVLANRSYYDVQPNLVSTSYTSNGNIGYSDRDRILGSGFTYNNMQLLNTGGVIFGNSTSEMVSSMDKSLGFMITSVIDTVQYADSIIGSTSYTPQTAKWDIDLAINQSYHTYLEENHEATIFQSYQIINNSDVTLDDYRFSLFTDWDIYNPKANNASYDQTLNMVYTYSYSSIVAYTAICLLNNIESTPYCFDIVEGGNGGLDISDGFSDEEKWFAMNNARAESGNNSYNMDVASMLSCGPFLFKPNDTIELSYALIAASNLEDLKEKARAAILKFTPPSTAIPTAPLIAIIYPNPASEKVYITINDQTPKKITLLDSQGRFVHSQLNKKVLHTQNISDGVYYLQIELNDQTLCKKLIITH